MNTQVSDKLQPFVEAAHDAGFTIHVPTPLFKRVPVGHVYVTREGDPGIALMQNPTLALEPITVDVHVKPNRVYGSAVVQDHDGTVEDVLRLLGELMTRDSVVPRFIGPHHAVPVDRRIPADAEVYA